MKNSSAEDTMVSIEQIEPQNALSRNLRVVADIPVRLSVEVGSATLTLNELLDLAEGSIVELNRQSHELLEVKVNGTLIARGEVVTVNGRFGVRIVDVVAVDQGLAGIDRRK